MNNIILFIIGKLKGFTPCCDRCLDVDNYINTISFIQYMRNHKGSNVYCRLCWNWIHLKHGTCKCGTYITQRSEWGENIKTCPKCFNIVTLKVKAQMISKSDYKITENVQ